MFILFNIDSQEFETFTMSELLEMINRDRSDEWSEYTPESTLEEIYEVVNTMCLPYMFDHDMPFKTSERI
jgi:hypothetical protein